MHTVGTLYPSLHSVPEALEPPRLPASEFSYEGFLKAVDCIEAIQKGRFRFVENILLPRCGQPYSPNEMRNFLWGLENGTIKHALLCAGENRASGNHPLATYINKSQRYFFPPAANAPGDKRGIVTRFLECAHDSELPKNRDELKRCLDILCGYEIYQMIQSLVPGAFFDLAKGAALLEQRLNALNDSNKEYGEHAQSYVRSASTLITNQGGVFCEEEIWYVSRDLECNEALADYSLVSAHQLAAHLRFLLTLPSRSDWYDEAEMIRANSLDYALVALCIIDLRKKIAGAETNGKQGSLSQYYEAALDLYCAEPSALLVEGLPSTMRRSWNKAGNPACDFVLRHHQEAYLQAHQDLKQILNPKSDLFIPKTDQFTPFSVGVDNPNIFLKYMVIASMLLPGFERFAFEDRFTSYEDSPVEGLRKLSWYQQIRSMFSRVRGIQDTDLSEAPMGTVMSEYRTTQFLFNDTNNTPGMNAAGTNEK